MKRYDELGRMIMIMIGAAKGELTCCINEFSEQFLNDMHITKLQERFRRTLDSCHCKLSPLFGHGFLRASEKGPLLIQLLREAERSETSKDDIKSEPP